MKHDRRMAVALIVCGLFFTIAASLSVFLFLDQSVSVIRDSLVASCERGNQIRERQNIVIKKLQLEIEPLPIIDCEKAVPK
jgi:hypothetical protein